MPTGNREAADEKIYGKPEMSLQWMGQFPIIGMSSPIGDVQRFAMDTGQIKGSGGIEGGHRGRLEESKSSEPMPTPGQLGDSASISDSSREILAKVEAMAERLKEQTERRPHVDEARKHLEEGALDQPEVFLETSRRMLNSGF